MDTRRQTKTQNYLVNKKKFHIPQIINGVLGGLVSITASCAVTGIWESLVIGFVGGVLVMLSDSLLVKLHIDDPVSAIPVHGVGGIWGLLAAGLFTHKDTITQRFSKQHGLVRGGGFYLLGIQTIAIVSIFSWSVLSSGLILKILDLTMGLRMSAAEEEIGADFVEHNIRSRSNRRRSVVLATAISELIRDGGIQCDTGDIIFRLSSPAAPTSSTENKASNGKPNIVMCDCERIQGRHINSKSRIRARFASLRNRTNKQHLKEITKEMALRNVPVKMPGSSSVSVVPSSASTDELTAVNSDIDS